MKKSILAITLAMVSTVSMAYNNSGYTKQGPIWLNIPGHYSPMDEQYIPALSLPTSNWDACADAIVAYAKDNLVYYIGCDVNPLRDASNLRGSRR